VATYRLNLASLSAESLKDYTYRAGERDESSLQKIIASNPFVITELPELELVDSEILLVCREYPTPRGNIDILIVTKNAQIILIETKLIRNPESTRTVVAQAIDYVKAFSNETIDIFWDKISKKKSGKDDILDKFKKDEEFITRLAGNIKAGDFRVIILGDAIHPNVLGMVESIQSAPHLSFTIYLVEINAAIQDENNIVITPKIVSDTLEIERSVIKIEVLPGGKHKIDSESPSKESKGSKPILTWEQFLDNVSNKNFRDIIEVFKKTWVSEIDDSINMGQVGFSAGLHYGNKRIPIQIVYDNRVAIISEKMKEAYNIPEKLYQEYREELSKSPMIYDKYVSGNKVDVAFDAIDAETLKLILNASLKLGKKIKNIE